ncbi:MAG: hypothetical protein JSS11_01180 [Verrucomicrobia bacterium]|nr:hypothetical protein [Verrucomicrobiota bacterium]
MSFAEFQASLAQADGTANPPAGLNPRLQALWYDARGSWDEAHRCVQDDSGGDGAWVHAYLHRKEGDAGNAAYWYSRAGKKMPGGTLDEEWATIVRALL